MKNKFWILIACLMLIATLTVVVTAAVADPEETVEPLGTCPKHEYSVYVGWSANSKEHTYRCGNEGCSSRQIEECFVRSCCALYSYAETVPCERCGNGSFEIHEYVPTHVFGTNKEEAQHISTCQGTDSFLICNRTSGGAEYCTLVDEIWPTYVEGRGHTWFKACSKCDYSYVWSYLNIVDHNPAECDYCNPQ